MKLTKKRGIGAVIGIAVFLVAFGIAFAITYYQAVITLKSGVTVTTTIIISGDNWSLWHDAAMLQPISGDLDFTWDITQTQAPLRARSLFTDRVFYIQNDSGLRGTPKVGRPLAPCQSFIKSDGTFVGSTGATLWADVDGDGNYFDWRGDTCWDTWPDTWVMADGVKWQIDPHPHFNSGLAQGTHEFDLSVGGILWLAGAGSPSPSVDVSSLPGPDAHPELSQ